MNTEPETAAAAASDEPHPLLSTAAFDGLERLCKTLSGFLDAPLDPAYVDGYACAIAASRRLIGAEEALRQLAADDFDRAFADPAAVADAVKTLDDWLQIRRVELDPRRLVDAPDEHHLSPLFDLWTDEDRAEAAAHRSREAEWGVAPQAHAEADDHAADEDDLADPNALQSGCMWAAGFLSAVDDFAADWPAPDTEDDSPEAEQYHAMLELLVCLTLPPDSETVRTFMDSQWQGKSPSRDEMLDETVFAVQDLRLYWLDHFAKPPQRVVPVKVGRNDPCPCGSGQKYKKCHGQ